MSGVAFKKGVLTSGVAFIEGFHPLIVTPTHCACFLTFSLTMLVSCATSNRHSAQPFKHRNSATSCSNHRDSGY